MKISDQNPGKDIKQTARTLGAADIRFAGVERVKSDEQG